MCSLSGCIVVTGGSGALGTEVARTAHAVGAHVALVGLPGRRVHLERVAGELGGGGRTCVIEADASSPTAWEGIHRTIAATLATPITGAVLTAGAWQGGPPLHEQKDDSIYRAMIVANLDSVYGSLRGLVPGMVARKRGAIVVIGSR